MIKVSVIIPGAGAGRRFGSGRSKIFQDLAGAPVFLRSVRLFSRRPDVCQVLLVVSAEDRPEIEASFAQAIADEGVQLVTGGPTRSQSVRNALDAVRDEAELVCVHDAVRPCLAGQCIDGVFAAAERTGAAILARPLEATLKRVAGDAIERTLDRSHLWQAQTPQVFNKSLLRRAYAAGRDATDDAHLVEQLGVLVTVVTGDPRNIKITTPADLLVAAAVIDSLP